MIQPSRILPGLGAIENGFLKEIDHLAEIVDAAIQDLRLKVHMVDTRFDDLLPASLSDEEKHLLTGIAEKYLRRTTPNLPADLRTGATPPAIGWNKSVRKEDIADKNWEWQYAQRTIADLILMKVPYNTLMSDYDRLGRWVHGHPEVDEKRYAAFRQTVHDRRLGAMLNLASSEWRDVYATFKIAEDPEYLIQLCARVAARKRGWDKAEPHVVRKLLDANNIPVVAYEFLTGWKVDAAEERYEDIVGAVAREATDAAATHPTWTDCEVSISLDRVVEGQMVRIGHGGWNDAHHYAEQRFTDVRFGLPSLKELIDNRQNLLQAASVWSGEVWEVQPTTGGNGQLKIYRNATYNPDTRRYEVNDNDLILTTHLGFRIDNLQYREGSRLEWIELHIPELYRHLVSNSPEPSNIRETLKKGIRVRLPELNKPLPMKLCIGTIGGIGAQYSIEPSRPETRIQATAYAICREAPRRAGVEVDLENRPVYDIEGIITHGSAQYAIIVAGQQTLSLLRFDMSAQRLLHPSFPNYQTRELNGRPVLMLERRFAESHAPSWGIAEEKYYRTSSAIPIAMLYDGRGVDNELLTILNRIRESNASARGMDADNIENVLDGVFDGAPPAADMAALAQAIGRQDQPPTAEQIRQAEQSRAGGRALLQADDIGGVLDAVDRGETPRQTIIEPGGIQPVVFENLVIYHPATGQPFRTYRRVVLDGQISNTSKTQDGWIQHYAETARQLPNFPLLYAMIDNLVRSGNPAKEALLADMRAYWIATSTLTDYKNGKMIHDKGRQPFELPCQFPEESNYGGNLDQNGQQTLKALLMPQNLATALQTLQTFSSVQPYLWVVKKDARQQYPKRAAFASIDRVRLDLSADGRLGDGSRSRGVAIEGVTDHTESSGQRGSELVEF